MAGQYLFGKDISGSFFINKEAAVFQAASVIGHYCTAMREVAIIDPLAGAREYFTVCPSSNLDSRK